VKMSCGLCEANLLCAIYLFPFRRILYSHYRYIPTQGLLYFFDLGFG
jgi:hypothetical protein